MKTALKLIILDFLVLQIIAPLLVAIPCALYLFCTQGSVDTQSLMDLLVIPAQLVGLFIMAGYLWVAGYVPKSKGAWTPVSGPYLLWAIVAMFSAGVLISALMELLPGLPDIMEQALDILQSNWKGMVMIAVLGPVVEELLFRGAVTDALLKRFSPPWAILISALLFGAFHINPAQMLPAFLFGLLFAWTYYKTGSLVPCILMHVFNNSLALYLSFKYPDIADFGEFTPQGDNTVVCIVFALLLIIALGVMGLIHKKREAPALFKRHKNTHED